MVTHLRKNDGKYEVLDGQQRLTTFYILCAVLKKNLNEGNTNLEEISKDLNLHFEAREESSQTLQNILKRHLEGEQRSIIAGFKVAESYLKEKKIDLEKFTTYFLEKVILVRTVVPEDIDLNHYFEIMNNRGEQLEKHEIIKARLLSAIINENQRSKYAKIWEACSQMESYVQMNFIKNEEPSQEGNNDKIFQIIMITILLQILLERK